MKNSYRDENICENEISLSKEQYIATVNAYDNSLSSEIVNVDCDSVSTIDSIVTPYTKSEISETESALTYASSDLERLQFSSENKNDSEDDSESVSTIDSIATPYTESEISRTESELTYTSSALERLQFSSENSTTSPYPQSELTYTSSALEDLQFPSSDETDSESSWPSSIELSGTTTENYWKDYQLLGLYNMHGTRNGAPAYKRARNAFMLGRDTRSDFTTYSLYHDNQSSNSFSGEIYFWFISRGEWIVTSKKEFNENKDNPGRWLWKKSQGAHNMLFTLK